YDIDNHFPFTKSKCRFNGITQATMNAFLYYNPVDHDFNGMLLILIEMDIIGHLKHFPIDTYTDVSFFFQVFIRFYMFTFTAGNNMNHYLHFITLLIFHNTDNHLLNRL